MDNSKYQNLPWLLRVLSYIPGLDILVANWSLNRESKRRHVERNREYAAKNPGIAKLERANRPGTAAYWKMVAEEKAEADSSEWD